MRFLIIFFSTFLYAASLINVNFFPHKRFVDILLSLDEKFNGRVVKISKNQYFISNVLSTRTIEKSFNNDFLEKVIIYPYENGIKLIIYPKTNIYTSAALTPEGYGIRFRIRSSLVKKEAPLVPKEIKKIDYYVYVLLFGLLFFLALLIIFLRKKRNYLAPNTNLNVKVVFQRYLDQNNRLILLEFNKRRYLLIIGNNNVVLDVFDSNMQRVVVNSGFEEVLKLNSKVDEIKKYIQNAEELKEIDERV